DRFNAGGISAAVGEKFPSVLSVRLGNLLGINRHHDALIAELFCRFLHKSAPADRGSVDRHLVGSVRELFAECVDRPHTAADRKRHEAGLRCTRHHVVDRVAVFMTCGDVEEAQLVGACRIICDGRLDGIAGVAQIDEIDALDHSAVFHVEAGNDANLEHQAVVLAVRTSMSASAASSRPSYSARPEIEPPSFFARGASSALISPIDARPPDAITGMEIASASEIVASRLRPCSIPSRAMSVETIAATPTSSKRRAISSTDSCEVSAQPSTATLPSRASRPTAMRPG